MNWRLFLQSTSDCEFEMLEREMWQEKSLRAQKISETAVELNYEEKEIALDVASGKGGRFNAIKAYRARTGQGLIVSRNVVDKYLATQNK